MGFAPFAEVEGDGMKVLEQITLALTLTPTLTLTLTPTLRPTLSLTGLVTAQLAA